MQPATCAYGMVVSVFVPYVRLCCLCCSVRCSAAQSIPFPFLAMRQPARAALRAASSCSPSPAVLQSAGRLQVKQAAPCVSFSDSLFCAQAGLRPASNASRYPGSAVPPSEGKAPQLHRMYFFLFSGFCRDWPSQSTARFDAPADPGRLVAVVVSAVGSILHKYGFMPVVIWDFQAFPMYLQVNKIRWSPPSAHGRLHRSTGRHSTSRTPQ